uniref:tRNA-splicing endonuclease subunit Sen15 domain-containing protein n=1 Tax=Spongospora subterranea TaxID=70186 RepID=A0A0H5QV87_9EUKA|eukprot:CRZ05667.1 hypothetical protein [Spongospora subterranea]
MMNDCSLLVGDSAQFTEQYSKYFESAQSLYIVYSDLLLSKKWHSLNVVDVPGIKSYVITGCAFEQEEVQAVIPFKVDQSLSSQQIHLTIDAICDQLCSTIPSCTLAFVDFDSTLSYFEFTSGLSHSDPVSKVPAP